MTPKLIGIQTDLMTKPLTQALRADTAFQLSEHPRADLAQRLRAQELAAALVSPLDYAKESSDYCIVPQVAAVSREGNNSIVLHFREGIQSIATVAVDPAYASEILLAKIILSEEFDIEPAIVPMMAPVETMLQKADAALLVSDAAFNARGTGNTLDLVEEWNDMTGLPFVHALWCGRERGLAWSDVEQLQQAALRGTAGIDDIVLAYPPDRRVAAAEYLRSFSYILDDEAREGLAEFLKYFYYHGILPDVADLNFYKRDDAGNDLLADVSPN